MQLWCLFLILVISIRCTASCDELEFTSYLSLGAAYQYSLVAPLDKTINSQPLLTLAADLQYRDFFIESDDQRNVLRFGSGLLGYYLWRNQNSSLSAITTSYHDEVGPNIFTLSGYKNIPELNGLELRHSDLLLGLRYQRFWDQHYVAIEFGHDIASHYGQHLRAIYSFRQPFFNWDFYYNVGMSFSTAKLVNYYYGITLPESLVERPVYRAGAGQQLHLGVNAVYPLSPEWLFELGLAVNGFSRAYTTSPLSSRDREFRSLVTFRYVF